MEISRRTGNGPWGVPLFLFGLALDLTVSASFVERDKRRRSRKEFWVKGSDRCGGFTFFGILRCAQNDSRNLQRQRQQQKLATTKATAETCNDKGKDKGPGWGNAKACRI
jgi:hypothetical protein